MPAGLSCGNGTINACDGDLHWYVEPPADVLLDADTAYDAEVAAAHARIDVGRDIPADRWRRTNAKTGTQSPPASGQKKELSDDAR